MKKSLLLLCATLSCSLAFAQGAELEDENNRVLIIPRVELNPTFSGGASRYAGQKLGLGGSSLYTLFEGDFNKSDFSYSIQGHWLTSDLEETRDLYTDLFNPQGMSFIDWAYLTYSPGNFEISLGKQPMAVGGYEIDAYDFDSYACLSSTMWNNFQLYQYALGVGYNFQDESNLTLQMSVTPHSNTAFVGTKSAPALYAWTAKWTAEHGCWAPIWSYSLSQRYKWDEEGAEDGVGPAIHMFALGNKFSFGNFDFIVDYTHRFTRHEGAMVNEGTAVSSLSYNLNDKFLFTLKGGYEFNKGGKDILGYESEEGDEFVAHVPTSLAACGDKGYAFGGARIEFFPLKESQDLRIHALAGMNTWTKAPFLSVGVTYNFNLLKYLR